MLVEGSELGLISMHKGAFSNESTIVFNNNDPTVAISYNTKALPNVVESNKSSL
jgi:hypothetical protein